MASSKRFVYVLLDTGTPSNPVVAVFANMLDADQRCAEQNAACGGSDFIVSAHEIQGGAK